MKMFTSLGYETSFFVKIKTLLKRGICLLRLNLLFCHFILKTKHSLLMELFTQLV